MEKDRIKIYEMYFVWEEDGGGEDMVTFQTQKMIVVPLRSISLRM